MEINNLESYECSCGDVLQFGLMNQCEKCAELNLKQLDEHIQILRLQKQNQEKQLQVNESEKLNKIIIEEQKGLKSFSLQNQQLQKQLQLLLSQLEQQSNLAQRVFISLQQSKEDLCSQFQQFYLNSLTLNRLNQQNQKLIHKNFRMNNHISSCQNVNIIHELFKITFQNDKSYINGQLIYFQNVWKIAQIICFFHHKYRTYSPTIAIYLDQMILAPLKECFDLTMCKKKKKIMRNQQIQFIQILCNSQEETQQWLYLIVLQVIKLSQFVIEQQNCHQKLIYEIKNDGSIEGIKLNNYEKYIKYLLSNINQLIKLEFYLMEARIKVSH